MAERLNLVTGATGFSGSHVVRELLRSGQRVLATDVPAAIESAEVREVLGRCGLDPDHPALEWVASDLLDPATLRPLFARPVTHVFHIASLYDYSASLEKLRRINVDGTRNLLEAVRDAHLERFVHWSTCGVFGKPYTAADGGRQNVPFAEDSSSPKTEPFGAEGPRGTHLVNEYSISKWEQEQLVWKAHREGGLPLTVIRPAPIYGPGSTYGHGGIILSMVQGFVPAVPADADRYVSASVHAEDIARFACWIAEQEEAVGEDYNIVDDSVVSQAEFLSYVALLVGRRLRTVPFLRTRWMRPLFMALARLWSRLQRRFGLSRIRILEPQSATYMGSSYWISNRKSLETGFSYRYPDVREGLKDTVAWLARMGWLTDRSKLLHAGTEGSKDSVSVR